MFILFRNASLLLPLTVSLPHELRQVLPAGGSGNPLSSRFFFFPSQSLAALSGNGRRPLPYFRLYHRLIKMNFLLWVAGCSPSRQFFSIPDGRSLRLPVYPSCTPFYRLLRIRGQFGMVRESAGVASVAIFLRARCIFVLTGFLPITEDICIVMNSLHFTVTFNEFILAFSALHAGFSSSCSWFCFWLVRSCRSKYVQICWLHFI